MRTLAVSVMLLLVAACSRTQTHHVLTGTPGAPYSGDVRIVMENAEVPKGVEEVAIVQAQGFGGHADLEHVLAGLTDEAKKLGCDMVVRVRIDQGATQASATGVAVRAAPPAPATSAPQAAAP